MLSTRTGLSPCIASLSRLFRFLHSSHWANPRSLATTSGVSFDVLSSGYLDVSVPRVRFHTPMNSVWDTAEAVGFPIRKSSDQSLFAAPRRLSQRTTSFVASQCQGIHQMLLLRLISAQTYHVQGSEAALSEDTNVSRRAVHHTIPDRITLALTRVDHCPTWRTPGRRGCVLDMGTRNETMIFPNFDHTDLRRYGRVRIVYFFTMSNNRQQTCGDDCSSFHGCRNRLSRASGRLNHRRIAVGEMVELNGIEPMTSCLQSTRSPN